MATYLASSSSSGSAAPVAATVLTAAVSLKTIKVKNNDHPQQVLYGIVVLVVVASLVNASYLAWVAYRRRLAHRGLSGSSASELPTNIGRVSLRRIPHAVLSASRIWSWRVRIPNVELNLAEVVFTVMYMFACVLWVWAPVDGITYPLNLAYKMWANRTGKLVCAQLPFIVLLSMRNNIFTLLLGLGHEKLNMMHRIVSRCMLILVWMHVVGMYYRAPAKLLTAGWKIAGVVGAISQTLTTLLSFKWFRRRFYETFYVSHVVFVIIFLITTQIHVRGVPVTDDYHWFVWAVWILDRVIRAGRYLYSSVLLRPKSVKARITNIGADGLRISLRRKLRWTPGQHAFLAFPELGIESHPFTIARVSEDGENGESELVFYVRVMHGLTRRLLHRTAATGSCELATFLDGPYGSPENLCPYSTCVFIAGGTGNSYTMPRMHQLLRDVKASTACAQRVLYVLVVRTETEYQWVANDLAKIMSQAPPSLSLTVEIYCTGSARGARYEDADDALEALDSLDKGNSSSSATSTHEDESDEKGPASAMKEREASSSSEGATPIPTKPTAAYFRSGETTPRAEQEDSEKAAVSKSVVLTRRSGRPDVHKILEEEVTSAQGAVAVDVSGPDALMDAVRRALCAPFAGPGAALRGTPTVMLSVEQFRM